MQGSAVVGLALHEALRKQFVLSYLKRVACQISTGDNLLAIQYNTGTPLVYTGPAMTHTYQRRLVFSNSTNIRLSWTRCAARCCKL